MNAHELRIRAGELRSLARQCSRPQGAELLNLLAWMHEDDAAALDRRTRRMLGIREAEAPRRPAGIAAGLLATG